MRVWFIQATDFFAYILKSQVTERENSAVPEEKEKNLYLCLKKKVYDCNHYDLVCFGGIAVYDCRYSRQEGFLTMLTAVRAAADAETQWQIT